MHFSTCGRLIGQEVFIVTANKVGNMSGWPLAFCIVLVLCSAAAATSPVPRPRGKIAFTSKRDGNREIYTMNVDGTRQTRITNNNIFDDHAMYSPDGSKLAFVSQTAAGGYAIFRMNSD